MTRGRPGKRAKSVSADGISGRLRIRAPDRDRRRGQRLAEALALLGTLRAEAFAEPRYALAYGLMLSEAGRARESEPLLNRASAERMLPDEMLLIEQARHGDRPRKDTGLAIDGDGQGSGRSGLGRHGKSLPRPPVALRLRPA